MTKSVTMSQKVGASSVAIPCLGTDDVAQARVALESMKFTTADIDETLGWITSIPTVVGGSGANFGQVHFVELSSGRMAAVVLKAIFMTKEAYQNWDFRPAKRAREISGGPWCHHSVLGVDEVALYRYFDVADSSGLLQDTRLAVVKGAAKGTVLIAIGQTPTATLGARLDEIFTQWIDSLTIDPDGQGVSL